MKITRRQLRKIIIETFGGSVPKSREDAARQSLATGNVMYWEPGSEEEQSHSAISHAQKTVREDGMSYEDFVGVIVDKLDLYDAWLKNYSIDEAVENLYRRKKDQ